MFKSKMTKKYVMQLPKEILNIRLSRLQGKIIIGNKDGYFTR